MSLRMINEVEGFTLGPFKDSGLENLRVIQGVSFPEMSGAEALLLLCFSTARVFIYEPDCSPC